MEKEMRFMLSEYRYHFLSVVSVVAMILSPAAFSSITTGSVSDSMNVICPQGCVMEDGEGNIMPGYAYTIVDGSASVDINFGSVNTGIPGVGTVSYGSMSAQASGGLQITQYADPDHPGCYYAYLNSPYINSSENSDLDELKLSASIDGQQNSTVTVSQAVTSSVAGSSGWCQFKAGQISCPITQSFSFPLQYGYDISGVSYNVDIKNQVTGNVTLSPLAPFVGLSLVWILDGSIEAGVSVPSFGSYGYTLNIASYSFSIPFSVDPIEVAYDEVMTMYNNVLGCEAPSSPPPVMSEQTSTPPTNTTVPSCIGNALSVSAYEPYNSSNPYAADGPIEACTDQQVETCSGYFNPGCEDCSYNVQCGVIASENDSGETVEECNFTNYCIDVEAPGAGGAGCENGICPG